MSAKETMEVWKNTAAGMRWFISYDRLGREASKTVPGGRTFTLSTFDRQVNQERAASAGQDLFRNGTFILVKESEETEKEEIVSTDAMTDAEIEQVVHDIMGDSLDVEDVIGDIESSITLGRILTQLVVEDARKSVIDKVKEKLNSKEGTIATERKVVVTKPSEE